MVVTLPSVPPAAQKQGKTKAKARYLKRKRERRRHRKGESEKRADALVPNSPAPEGTPDTSSDSESGPEEVAEVAIEAAEPPQKRRKADSDVAQDLEDPEEAPEQDVESRAHPPSLVTGFPSFPLPAAPDAPSKETLALQGLDKALLGAEIVDPSKALPTELLNAGRDPNAGDLPVVSEKMKKRLLDLGITEFFAVQTALLPFLLPPHRRKRALYCPYDPPQDVCASAPTGSGKTLAYVIPIVEILSTRITTRLRALVVLPTRDLVLQVQETVEVINKGRGLKIGVATGQHSFAHEQSQLVNEQDNGLRGGASKVDILICTPGRLIDHITGTPGFTLQHLRFLVIDEADRLLAQSFQDWLAQVLNALRPSASSPFFNISKSSSPEHLRHDALAPSFLPHISTDLDDPKQISCQKLLFSATLTRDPARIAALGLRDPKYFIVQNVSRGQDQPSVGTAVGMQEFAMPAGLKEHYITTSGARKPLIFFYLVHMRGVSNALVFTKSAESTTRLVKLLEFFEKEYSENAIQKDSPSKRVVAHAYSSDLSPSERKTILEKFKMQEVDILVCSDLVARGLDIPHVEHVVSYDAPVDVRKYVHRAGRTARAGRLGNAWSLVEEQEAKFFKDMLREAGDGRLERVTRVRVRDAELKDMEGFYDTALGKLREAYSRSHTS